MQALCSQSNCDEFSLGRPSNISNRNYEDLDAIDALGARKAKLPVSMADFCYIVFENRFSSKMGCKIFGDGPTVVEWVEDVRMKMTQGELRHTQGNYITVLIARGLYPSVGDVIVEIDGTNVEHLPARQVYMASI